MIESIWEEVCRLRANSATFYMRGVGILGIPVSVGVLEPAPQGYWGTIVMSGQGRCMGGCFETILNNESIWRFFPYIVNEK